MLPNFLIIGAQKAATTSLHSYIDQHPDIYMSPKKEPFYFTHTGMNMPGNNMVTELEDYKMLFSGRTNEKIVGESSTTYLACPWTPRLIHETIPEVKMVAILRNPIDRAWSQFKMHRRKGVNTFSNNFDEALAQFRVRERGDEKWETGYVEMGMYHKQLMRYYSYFKQEQIKLFLYDDILDNLSEVLTQIFDFLQVDPDVSMDVNYRRNTSSTKKSNLSQWNPFSRKEKDKMQMSQGARSRLIHLYEDEVMELSQLIDRDLSHWLKG